MKRRSFVLLSTIGFAAIGTSSWYLNYYKEENRTSIVKPESLSFIWNNETIISIGIGYRKKLPSEDSEQTLRKLLLKGAKDDINKMVNLKNKITNDFETGNTVTIDGWIISVTEARQCALFSITQPS